jgi:hypothetical protein
MIHLDIKEYCQCCVDFSPDVINAKRYYNEDRQRMELSDTIVQCEHRRRCEAIRRYLEAQMKTEEAVG